MRLSESLQNRLPNPRIDRAHKTMILLILLGRCEHCQMKIVSGWLSPVNDLLYKLGTEHGARRIADLGLRIAN